MIRELPGPPQGGGQPGRYGAGRLPTRLLCSLIALLGPAACGVSQELYSARTSELNRCQRSMTRSEAEVASARTRGDELASETTELREQVTTLRSDRFKLAADLSATERELDELRRSHALAEQRAEVYRTLLSRLRSMIETHQLAVEIRKGKMVVKLAEAVLFDAGKAVLKPVGRTALRPVAAALKEIPDRDFLVAGHTDNQPIRSASFRSNWELSAARAVAVVRFLQAEGVDPRRLGAAGFSEFDFVADNGSAAERARNRRIEVIVMPRIDELPSVDPKLAEPARSVPATPRLEPVDPATPAPQAPPQSPAPAAELTSPPAPQTGSPPATDAPTAAEPTPPPPPGPQRR